MAATLADQWTAHANRTLPNDASRAQVIRARRDWYHARLLALKAEPESAQNAALIAEAIGFGRAIGTPAEAALLTSQLA